MKRDVVLKMLAPYLTVAVFWCGFHNAWLAILAYHLQILLWSRGSFPTLRQPRADLSAWLLVPTAMTGLAVYFVVPLVARVDVAAWLAACFAILAGASFVWQQMARRTGGIALPVVSHMLADFGMIVAVWLLVSR